LAYCAPNASDLPRYSVIKATFGLAGLAAGGLYVMRLTLPIDRAALIVTPATVREIIEV